METKKANNKKAYNGISAAIVILACFIIAVCFYQFVLGNPANFMDNNPANHPLPGNYFGTVYKGGYIVPVVITLFLTVVTLSIERMIAIGRSKGRKNLVKFVQTIKKDLEEGNLDAAHKLCSEQKGSVANVVNAALSRYSDVESSSRQTKEQKILIIQKEIEESTALELPSMEQNLPVIATISTLGTLFGLLGTVLGMIRSFAALANAGAPDSVALSTGISEALVNTALGIATGALAIISYNYFTSKIDNITYAIDEIGFSIVQTFAAKH
ncbi:MotA/TolQ/ExbB proton channel family protein [uncultured Parabacteroides sp.]|jgi:biopolymer transport protein ExbB|uniref:MotA/TolQ/ExbB proton channel family protein n=1 Tax=uncultured Parabacteroides sp. TaxID=512312 RepID=UPI0025FAA0BC|nr:MotA/TolQ/ExbB proton channel family protein [uncultured Parabacteroides sp.]